MSENNSDLNMQTRVCVYDKDEEWCNKIERLLSSADFYCDTECQQFSECSINAHENPYNYAIVNYHSLVESKKELLDFKNNFPNTEIILLGDHDDPTLVRYLWPPEPIAHYNFGGKNDHLITELRKLIINLDQLRRKLGHVQITFLNGVDELLDDFSRFRFQSRSEEHKNRKHFSLSTMKQELRAVLEAIFASKSNSPPIANEVVVEPFVESGKSSSCMLKLTPKILIGESNTKSAVLKFGPKEDISIEAENYDRFVEWFLTVDQTVRKIGYGEANRFSGILYSYPRDIIGGYQPFAKFLRNQRTEECASIIEAMFNTRNKHWLGVEGNRHVDQDFTIFQEYYINHVIHADIPEMRNQHLKKLKTEVRKIERKMKNEIMEIENGMIVFPEFNLRIPNAIERLGKDQLIEELKMTVIHGDLHAHNILITKGKRYFFIDFFYTGFGHIYRDFIELEISIRYDLFSSREITEDKRFTASDSTTSNIKGMKKLIIFEKELLKASIYNKELRSNIIAEDERLSKAFNLISEIRKLAKDNHSENFSHYYAGFAFSCLKAVKYFYPADVKMYRLIMAGLYLDILDKTQMLSTVKK